MAPAAGSFHGDAVAMPTPPPTTTTAAAPTAAIFQAFRCPPALLDSCFTRMPLPLNVAARSDFTRQPGFPGAPRLRFDNDPAAAGTRRGTGSGRESVSRRQ
ncbi:hypothetical protein MN0502_09770 [Arthrobacter sp. MN05-02]|nr:hypothetical protein MN0502_09770 [Arthrobacter sp. MN05-02]